MPRALISLLLSVALAVLTAPWPAAAAPGGCFQRAMGSLSAKMGKGTETPVERQGFQELPSGHEMFYKFLPPRPDRPVVVFLHGLGDDCSEWDRETEMLAERGYGVLRMDLNGQGRTLEAAYAVNFKIPNSIPYADNVKDVADLIQALGIKDTILAGHSMGGGVALALAGKLPKRTKLRGLLLIAPYVYRLDSARAYWPHLAPAEQGFWSLVPQNLWDALADSAADFLIYPAFGMELARKAAIKRLRRGAIPAWTLLDAHRMDVQARGSMAVTKGMRSLNGSRLVAHLPGNLSVSVVTGLYDWVIPPLMMMDFKGRLRSRGDLRVRTRMAASDHETPRNVPSILVDEIQRLDRTSRVPASKD